MDEIQTAKFLNSKDPPPPPSSSDSSSNSDPNNFEWSPENWGLERAMRVLMVKKFQELPPNHEQYDLQRFILSSLAPGPSQPITTNIPTYLKSISHEYFAGVFDQGFNPPLAIQNDGDEMLSSIFLLLLKKCELNEPSIFPIQPLTYHFKYNFHTLQRERKWQHRTCPQDDSFLLLEHSEDLIIDDSDPKSESIPPQNYIPASDIYNYLWVIGPKVDLLYNFLEHNSTLRQHYSDGAFFENTLCLGSGFHISSVEEPGEVRITFNLL